LLSLQSSSLLAWRLQLFTGIRTRSELANQHFFPEEEEERNRFQVLLLYEALNAGDAPRAQELLAPDLEWRFHGPPARQHMMRLLTGAERGGFAFTPRSVDAFGSTVIAEGADDARQLYWVHAWTVGPDGVITQLREYFNTDLTVTLLSATAKDAIAAASNKQEASSSSSSSSGPKCLWQSRRAQKSLPGLVLAI
jgi:ketosteroid isomerase-like protein